MPGEVRRAYEEPGPDDGTRVLVDRLWPRGIVKERLRLDRWAELEVPPAAGAVEELRSMATRHPLILLTATRDVPHSGAAVLAEAIS